MSRRLELALALLLAVAVGVAAWAARRSGAATPDFDSRASTFLTGPRGSRALYDVLARLRIPVERRRTSLFDLERDVRHRPAVLAVLDPPLDLEAAELAQVARFVRAGGAVVAAGEGGGIARCVGWRPAYGARFAAPDSFPIAPPRPGLVLPRVANYLKPVDAGGNARPRRALGGEEDECETLGFIARDTLLRLADGRPAAVRLRAPGGGSVTLVADVGYFRNRTWRESDVPQFVTPLLVPARRGRVVWDEYHQGFGKEGSPAGSLVGWLVGTPGGWALLQLVAVALVGLATAGVRFGPARAVLTRRRRSPLEHLEALAAGLEGAAGVETSIRLTIAGLRRRLGRVGAMAPDEQRAWLATLELALPSAAGRNAVRRLQRVINQPGGPERTLAAAQAVEDVWQELRPPQMRARS
ncbi:MAG TPA: DUF4350 domain-containing protein [Gemmatimonadales bacterium]|jgi:hypothetical protein|nr:DUF4350 domain-containing protein [Gemmatimonadales bacterium]